MPTLPTASTYPPETADAWLTEALCAQTDPEVFFPERGSNARAAKRICLHCDVIAQCRDWALSTGQQEGVWGGLSETERRTLLRHNRAA